MSELMVKTNNINRIIGATVKEVRKEAGLSQSALAERLGITFQQVQKYEKGTNRIALSTFFLICGILDVSTAGMIAAISRTAHEDGVDIYTGEVE